MRHRRCCTASSSLHRRISGRATDRGVRGAARPVRGGDRPRDAGELTTDIDRFVYDRALSVFLCAPQALYAVNRHVAFGGYAASFELAETQASPQHWSRR
jgi:hypothetical protein